MVRIQNLLEKTQGSYEGVQDERQTIESELKEVSEDHQKRQKVLKEKQKKCESLSLVIVS